MKGRQLMPASKSYCKRKFKPQDRRKVALLLVIDHAPNLPADNYYVFF
jgi:hypothetical protein